MKVLFISNDPTLFESTSMPYARMKTYASAIGELHILSRATYNTEVQDGNLHLHGLRPLPTIIGRALFFYTLLRNARALMRRHHIEVVSAQDPFEHGWIARRAVATHSITTRTSHAKDFTGTPAKLHIQIHTDFLSPYFAKESYKNRLRVRIADSVLPSADGIRAVSERIKKSLTKRYEKRIQEPVIIPIIVDTTTPLPVPLPKHTFKFTLISVGRIEVEKRIDDILYALKLLTKQYPMIGLFIVGDGRERNHLERLVHMLGLDNNVVFLGNRFDARGLISSANVFIQTSAYEGYGRTYIEAALSGVPMIVTDTGIINDVFMHDDSALVCPVDDVTCLSRHIANIVEDMVLRHQLVASAKVAVRKYIDSIGDIPKRIANDLAKTISHKREL